MNGVAAAGGVSSVSLITNRQYGSHKKYISPFSRVFTHQLGVRHF